MNRYALIHRLRGPAVLLLIGVLALFDQMGIITRFWGWFWPLLMITIGTLMLAERAALASEDYYPPQPYPGAPYQGGPYPGPDPGVNSGQQPANTQPGTAIVPSGSDDFGGNGGRL
jgi:LiaF transmembrane domain